MATEQGPTGTLNGPFVFNNEISPPQITANQDDYAPTGLDLCNVMRIDSSALFNITGMQAPVSPRFQQITMLYVGASSIRVKDNDANSLETNRILLGAVDIILQTDESLIIIYDAIDLRWRIVSKHA